MLRVVEIAAIESARTMGQGDQKMADQVATEAMRQTMDTVPMRGTIVIGEANAMKRPCCISASRWVRRFRMVEKFRLSTSQSIRSIGRNESLCATGAPGSITVLAASEKGGLLNAPDCYMEKIVVGPSCKDAVHLDVPVEHNLKNIAKRLDRDVRETWW